MKKKFLSLLLAICMIIPCAFSLTACGRDDEPKTLAGKTIQCSNLYQEFNFNREILLFYQEGLSEPEYRKTVTYNELLELTLGTEAFTYPNGAIPTTLDEAKVLFEQMIKGMFCTMSVNPWVHFSDDLTKANIYYSAEAMSKGESAAVYDVEYVDTNSGKYILKSDGEEIVSFDALSSSHDEFLTSYVGEQHPLNFVVNWKTLSMNICEIEVTLTEYPNPSSTITKRLDEVFGNEQTVHVSPLYTVMK